MVLTLERTGVEIVHKDSWVPEEFDRAWRQWTPQTDLGAVIYKLLTNGYNIPLDERRALFECVRRAAIIESSLSLVVYRTPQSQFWAGNHNRLTLRDYKGLLHVGTLDGPVLMRLPGNLDQLCIEDWGVVSKKQVTDNGVGLIVDTFDNTLANGDCRYHGIGTGSSAEGSTETALVTELTTEYNPDSTRATGTFSQPAANQSRSVATNTVDNSVNLREHAPFTQAATGGGTMLDRSLYSSVNLSASDSLQSTYTISLTSGG